MSEILVLERPAVKERKKAGKVRSALRVMRDGRWVGDVLLDRKGRVWRHVPSIPSDVVFKAVAAFTRGEIGGELTGRRDGLTYLWHEVLDPVEANDTDTVVVVNLTEAA